MPNPTLHHQNPLKTPEHRVIGALTAYPHILPTLTKGE